MLIRIFSGTAFLQSPVSSRLRDPGEPALAPARLPPRGRDELRPASIDTALEAFSASSAADRYLIILSDGGGDRRQLEGPGARPRKKGDPRPSASAWARRRERMIPDGSGSFMKDENGAGWSCRSSRAARFEALAGRHTRGLPRREANGGRPREGALDDGRPWKPQGRSSSSTTASGMPSATSGRWPRPSPASSRASCSSSRFARSPGIFG